MKSFKVRDGKMLIDGVYYSETKSETTINGKWGRIQSISINGKQFFPYDGEFIDDTLKVTEDSTGIVEDVKPIKKPRKTK
jgi:hypothetical protein